MSTRKIVVLALCLVAAGIALVLILGKESGSDGRATSHAQEKLLEPRSCFAPVSELFWRARA